MIVCDGLKVPECILRSEITELELVSRFRCNGSNGYSARGDDIRYEDGHVVTDFTKRASTDQSVKGLKKMYKEKPDEAIERADEIIKNTYRTLMTRGMKGCYIYCTDPGMREYIRERLSVVPKGES